MGKKGKSTTGGSLNAVPSDSISSVDKSRDLSTRQKIEKRRKKVPHSDSPFVPKQKKSKKAYKENPSEGVVEDGVKDPDKSALKRKRVTLAELKRKARHHDWLLAEARAKRAEKISSDIHRFMSVIETIEKEDAKELKGCFRREREMLKFDPGRLKEFETNPLHVVFSEQFGLLQKQKDHCTSALDQFKHLKERRDRFKRLEEGGLAAPSKKRSRK